jgi:hypothetical protein
MGADAVMMGSPLAKATQAPGLGWHWGSEAHHGQLPRGNTAVGFQTLSQNTTAASNTAIGYAALLSNTTGAANVAVGASSLQSNTTASANTVVGAQAGFSITSGTNNTAVGYQAAYSQVTGTTTVAVGYKALTTTTTTDNTGIGANALELCTTGNSNTALGYYALRFVTTGKANIGIGPVNSGGASAPVFSVTTEDNRIAMGHTGITNAYIQVAWTVVSDLRDKVVLGDVPLGLDFVRKLKPIKYQFKETRESNTPHGAVKYGFGAQDVLAEEGDNPVIVDTEVADKLKITDSHMMPVFANAIKEMADMIDQLKAEIAALKGA